MIIRRRRSSEPSVDYLRRVASIVHAMSRRVLSADRLRPSRVRSQRRLRLRRPIAASARGCSAHLAAGRARPRAGADRRHFARRNVGALPGRRRDESCRRRGVTRRPGSRAAGHARRSGLHRAVDARPAPARRADRLAQCCDDATMARGVIGPGAAKRAPERFFEVVHEGMHQPGFRMAMLSHMWLALRFGRPRPENFLSVAHGRPS